MAGSEDNQKATDLEIDAQLDRLAKLLVTGYVERRRQQKPELYARLAALHKRYVTPRQF